MGSVVLGAFFGAVSAVIVVAVRSAHEEAHGAITNIVGFVSTVGVTAIIGGAAADLNETAMIAAGIVCYGAIVLIDIVLHEMRSG